MIKILKESIRAVPAMKYALAVAGIMSVVGLVSAFRISPQTAVFGAVIVLILMVALVIFARLTTTAPRHFLTPVLVMLWSFLGLVVATAILLFSCAFFQWPKAIHDLIGMPSTALHPNAGKRVSDLLLAAGLQLDARDYEGAWRGIQEAVSLAPDSKPAREEQVLVAMAWLRDLDVVAPATFSEIVDRVSPCLYQSASSAKGARAADIYAHLGWGNCLKSRDGVENLKIEGHYKTAIELDPANPFAQAMWGHWLLTERGQLAAARAHFQKAIESGREKEYVRHLQLAALQWEASRANDEELLRVLNEMRQATETLSANTRKRLAARIYMITSGDDFVEQMPSLRPPADHLATFLWLTDGMDMDTDGMETLRMVLAHLTEAVGDFPKAMLLYQKLLAQSPFFEKPIKAGLDRCRKHAPDIR